MSGNKLLITSAIVLLCAISLIVGSVFYIKKQQHLLEKIDKTLTNGARIEWTPCWFDDKKADLKDYSFSCAWLHTAPSLYSKRSEYSLPIVVVHYNGFDYEPDPVLFMAGGPGSSILLDDEGINHYWLSRIKKSSLRRDFVLYDQRGSGLSKPKLTCSNIDKTITGILSSGASPKENAQRRYEALKACHAELVSKNAPISELGTAYSALDVRDMMSLMSYETWNLNAVSYSTRLAMEVQRIAPEKVRSMVLDSVYPTNKHLFKEWPELLHRSIERIFNFCKSNQVCFEQHGDIREKFWAIMERLKQQPKVFRLDDQDNLMISQDLDLDKVVMTDEIFIALLFETQYHSGALVDLPELIASVYDNDDSLIRSYVYEYIDHQFDDNFSEPIFWSVECNDNKHLSRDETLAVYQQYPLLRRYLIEDYDPCDIWNSQLRKPPLHVKFNDKIPVLVFAGEDDPVTPYEWAEETIMAYGKSFLFNFGGISHGVVDSMLCSSELRSRFIDNPEKRPSADCRDDSRYY